jgi:hypothetical protein
VTSPKAFVIMFWAVLCRFAMSFGRLKRRELIAVLSDAAASWPLAVRAQQPAIPRVGHVWVGARGTDVSHAGLCQGLADRGYIVGQPYCLRGAI